MSNERMSFLERAMKIRAKIDDEFGPRLQALRHSIRRDDFENQEELEDAKREYHELDLESDLLQEQVNVLVGLSKGENFVSQYGALLPDIYEFVDDHRETVFSLLRKVSDVLLSLVEGSTSEIDRFTKLQAETSFKLYYRYIKAGFSDEQAFALLLAKTSKSANFAKNMVDGASKARGR